MPGCLKKAEWVHGSPMEDGDGATVFPWNLCQECHEVTRAADLALHEAGIPYPDDAMWCFEAARTMVAQIDKNLKQQGLES